MRPLRARGVMTDTSTCATWPTYLDHTDFLSGTAARSDPVRGLVDP